MSALLETRDLTVRAGERTILRGIDLSVEPASVLAVVGPSGVGKSTLLRCLNRLVELTDELSVSGDILLGGESVLGTRTDPDALRRRVGIVLQQPVVFPGSILENVVFGVRRTTRIRRRDLPAAAEAALREAALWSEVEDRLGQSAARLSVGQRQRLCLARALASKPEVLLMDEPTSALDARSAESIEARVRVLSEHTAVVLVTHDLEQADRLATRIARLELRDGAGELAEVLETRDRAVRNSP